MCSSENFVKIGRREVGEIVRCCVDKKSQVFWGVAEGRFPAPLRRAWADRAQIFTHHVPFEVLCLCWISSIHPPRLSFGGVMPPTPFFASLQYGLPYCIWQAISLVQSVLKAAYGTILRSAHLFTSAAGSHFCLSEEDVVYFRMFWHKTIYRHRILLKYYSPESWRISTGLLSPISMLCF